MASIDVTINFTYRNLPTGRITVTPTENYIDAANKIVVAGVPFPSVNIVAGSGSVVVPSTKDYGVGLNFLIESGASAPYTKIDEFIAVIDNITPQNGNTLITGFFSQDLLDTSIYAITDLLSKTPFIDRLSARIPGFVFKNYTTTQTFNKNEFTFRGQRLYQWLKTTSGTNIDPLTAGNYTDPGTLLDGTTNVNASWLVVTSSLIGTGITTTNLVYDKPSFANLSIDPASRQNLTELDTILRAEIIPNLTNYARTDQANTFSLQQTFGISPTTPDLGSNDSSSKVANSRTVQAIIAANAGFVNLSNRLSIVEERYAEGTDVSLSTGMNTRQINTIHRNGNGDIISLTNAVTTIKAGTYLIYASSMTNRCDGSKILLWDELNGVTYTTRSMSSYAGSNLANTNQSNNVETTLLDVLTFAINAPLSLKQTITLGKSTAGGIGANRPGYSELFSRILFFRLI